MTNPRSTSKFITYFRPAELALLLEPSEAAIDRDRLRDAVLPEDRPPLDDETLDRLDEVLQSLSPDAAHPYSTALGRRRVSNPDGRPRGLVPIDRRPGGLLAFQTVNLNSHRLDLRKRTTEASLHQPLSEVGFAVRGLNRLVAANGGRLNLGEYSLIAAAPNWLAAPT